MADADVRLDTVSKDGAPLSSIIPAGSAGKDEGKSLLAGKWQIPQCGQVTLTVAGNSVRSVETPFGNAPLLGEIEESGGMLGLHVTMGGFPMKAWLEKGDSTVLKFSNGGRWSKL